LAVTSADLVERLAGHTTLGGAPREELAWLAAHGSLRMFAEGDVLSVKGVPVAGLFVVLTGRVAIYLDRGAGRQKLPLDVKCRLRSSITCTRIEVISGHT
jgi:signal-transduction protein with cAMP-binding, CBS, and nucleotidyltransferase domain